MNCKLNDEFFECWPEATKLLKPLHADRQIRRVETLERQKERKRIADGVRQMRADKKRLKQRFRDAHAPAPTYPGVDSLDHTVDTAK